MKMKMVHLIGVNERSRMNLVLTDLQNTRRGSAQTDTLASWLITVSFQGDQWQVFLAC